MSFLTPCPESLKLKLSRFTSGNTRIVADFDSTITTNNGKTSWSLFADSWLMPAEYVARRTKLKEEYYPYEIDSSISEELRNEKMREWWLAHLNLLVEFWLRHDILEKVVNHEMKIRSGMDGMLLELEKLNIPVLVLSAGLKESIESVLKAHNLLSSNISIASNSLVFNSSGVCSGIHSDEIIHACNKDEWDAPENVRETYTSRSNILLFGDGLDDIKMIHKEERENTVAVGFCTSNRRHQKQEFLDTFDIIVESDIDDGEVGEFLLRNIAQ